MRLGLISAAYPPDLDGIGDYTWWLAKALAAQDETGQPVAVFTRTGEHLNSEPGVELVPFFDPARGDSFARLGESFATAKAPSSIRNLDWLVLQYNPFGFGRRGYCPAVPRTLARLRQQLDSPRLAVMFHETMVPRWPWRFAVMRLWQKPIFRALCRLADAAFVSTERWLSEVRRANARLPVRHLPVGSNVPECTLTKGEARGLLGLDADAVVLGVFGGGHVSRRLDWIGATARELARARPGTVVLHVGPDGPRVAEACAGVRVVALGVQPAEKVGVALRAMDVLLSPFDDGVSTRRGSVMAALQHGLPVATTERAWTDSVFRRFAGPAFLLADAKDERAFIEAVTGWFDFGKAEAAEALRAFHREHLAWPALAANMSEFLAGLPLKSSRANCTSFHE